MTELSAATCIVNFRIVVSVGTITRECLVA